MKNFVVYTLTLFLVLFAVGCEDNGFDSISDDGSEIVFVNENGKLHYIRIDWSTNTKVEEGELNFSEIYRNVSCIKLFQNCSKK